MATNDGLPRDEHLRAALRHAPDAGLGAPPLLSAGILAAARRAAEATPARQRARWWGFAPWQGAGTLAAVALVSVVLWQQRDALPPASAPTEQAALPAAAPAPSAPPATAPQLVARTTAPAAVRVEPAKSVGSTAAPAAMAAAEAAPAAAPPPPAAPLPVPVPVPMPDVVAPPPRLADAGPEVQPLERAAAAAMETPRAEAAAPTQSMSRPTPPPAASLRLALAPSAASGPSWRPRVDGAEIGWSPPHGSAPIGSLPPGWIGALQAAATPWSAVDPVEPAEPGASVLLLWQHGAPKARVQLGSARLRWCDVGGGCWTAPVDPATLEFLKNLSAARPGPAASR